MKFRIEQIYECELQDFLEQYFDGDRRTERETNGAGAVSFRILNSKRDGDVWSHVAETSYAVNGPAMVRKIFGETTRMEEHASWRQGTNIIDIEYVPEKMKSKISCKGHLKAEDAGNGKTRVNIELDVTVKIFGVGALVEKFVAKEFTQGFTRDCAYFNKMSARG